jgi:RimJ/RimL family protein N-acetyltransferase
MDQATIEARWLRLRPFAPADIPWVYEVSLDPALQQYVQLPSPYRLGRVGLALAGGATAEVGYWVDFRTRGRGVATDAVRALCRWAFDVLGLDLIEWRCEVGNLASRRVAEKAGFIVEATLRQRLVHRGVRVDAWVGSLLKDELSRER